MKKKNTKFMNFDLKRRSKQLLLNYEDDYYICDVKRVVVNCSGYKHDKTMLFYFFCKKKQTKINKKF